MKLTKVELAHNALVVARAAEAFAASEVADLERLLSNAKERHAGASKALTEAHKIFDAADLYETTRRLQDVAKASRDAIPRSHLWGMKRPSKKP